ncbi:acetoacetate decarboxylase family protein [Lentzea sp. NPDC060358]|uniref:acetoacetate decarboxylase family protein n=1 Tax=Lentzea sp. NPDC060358 TaxID=3347103 RepID=UPI00365A70AC
MPADFPPPPWHLCGRGWLTVATAPRPAISRLVPGVVPLVLFGRVLVVSAFVDYDETGVLAYRELMVGVVVRKGFRLGLSITDIWVDDETSRRGARAMWGIPKEMAEFELAAEPRLTAAARVAAAPGAGPGAGIAANAPDASTGTAADVTPAPRPAAGTPTAGTSLTANVASTSTAPSPASTGPASPSSHTTAAPSGTDPTAPAATIATAEERPRRSPALPALPALPVRLTTSVWQSLAGTAVRTRLHTAARVRPTRLRWHVPPTSPLHRLTTAKPRLSLAVTALRMRFGEP